MTAILWTYCLLAVTLVAVHGFKTPSRKTWWSKRVTSDSFHTAGRLSMRQLKYASEAGFRTVVSLNYYDSNEGDESAIGGNYFPNTTRARDIVHRLTAMSFQNVLAPDTKDWKKIDTVSKLHVILRGNAKPVLFFSDNAYDATFLLLTHFANVTKHDDVKNGESNIDFSDVFEIGAQLGFDFGTDESFQKLVTEVTRTSNLTSYMYTKPDTQSNDWYKKYWHVKPVYKNIFISGQMQSDHLKAIGSMDIAVIVNSRKGNTIPPNTKSQEEVTLLNIKDRTGTYTGTGRQSISQLQDNRVDSKKTNEYISADSTVNYDMNNTLEFGDNIGYNEAIERNSVKQILPDVQYVHLPIGGQHKYGKDLWKAYRDTIEDINKKGLVLFQCRTGFRSAALGVMAAAYINCYNSTWAISRAQQIGYDYPSVGPSVSAMYRAVLDGRDCVHGMDSSSSRVRFTVSHVVSGVLLVLLLVFNV